MKEKRLLKIIKLLNPKNLAYEVHVYGYHFSWKRHLFLIVCALLGIGVTGVLFQLKPLYFMVSAAAVGVMLPVFILYMYKRMFEQKRFADAVTYAEQVLYSFQKSKKIVSALKETREIFEDGRMQMVLEDAIRYLESGCAKTEKGVLWEALDIIEQSYACTKIHMVHELLISSEEYGGDVDSSILLVLNDIELWKRREYMLQADKKVSHMDNMISIVIAAVLCATALYVLDAMGKMFPGITGISIFSIEIIQLSSLFFILMMLYVLAKSFGNLTLNWLQNDSLHEEAYLLSSYRTVVAYEEAKEKKHTFRLFWSYLGYHLAQKDITDELYLALPQWLMGMALLLQNNNVQVAIEKSMQEAPIVLQKELELLRERLQKEPDKLKSYTGFCKSFDIPEIQSCMKMLHAISESGTGNAQIQINNLIQRVHEMQDMADGIRNKDIAFRMKFIFSYPVLAATLKLLIDLTLGMFYMLTLLGTMGGV